MKRRIVVALGVAVALAAGAVLARPDVLISCWVMRPLCDWMY